MVCVITSPLPSHAPRSPGWAGLWGCARRWLWPSLGLKGGPPGKSEPQVWVGGHLLGRWTGMTPRPYCICLRLPLPQGGPPEAKGFLGGKPHRSGNTVTSSGPVGNKERNVVTRTSISCQVSAVLGLPRFRFLEGSWKGRLEPNAPLWASMKERRELCKKRNIIINIYIYVYVPTSISVINFIYINVNLYKSN